VGTGVWDSVEEACERCITVTSRCAVREGHREVYEVFYPVFRRLYRSLEGDFDVITDRVARLHVQADKD
jgi:hypothetical protein